MWILHHILKIVFIIRHFMKTAFNLETNADLHWKDTSTITLLLIYTYFQEAHLHLNFDFTTFHWCLFPFAFIYVLLLYCSNYSHYCSLLSLCLMLLENIINVIPNGFLTRRVWPLGRMKTRSIANKLLLREMVLKHTGLEN